MEKVYTKPKLDMLANNNANIITTSNQEEKDNTFLNPWEGTK